MNLIVTCARHMEPDVEEEIVRILGHAGDDGPTTTITRMPGILTVQTALDPFMVVEGIKKVLEEDPWELRYCLRIIPVQETVDTGIEEIVGAVECVRGKISKKDTYRVTVEKRNSEISGQELISRIAERIPNEVSLEKPEKIVLVQILGDQTGVAVVTKKDILSTEKLKRSLS